MESQRQQAYIKLIEELLACPKGEEEKVISQNKHLLDIDFLNILDDEAKKAADSGNNFVANLLLMMSDQLCEELNLTWERESSQASSLGGGIATNLPVIKKESLDTNLDTNPGTSKNIETKLILKFLLELLSKIAENNAQNTFVYPFLEKNLDQINADFIAVLDDWAAKNLTKLERDDAEALSAVLRSEEHTSELQSRETISYAVFCLKKKKT